MSPRPWPRLGGVFSRLEIHLQYRRDFFSCLITPHRLKLNNKIYEGRGEKVRKGNVSYIVNSHLRLPPFPPAGYFAQPRAFAISFQLADHFQEFLTEVPNFLRGIWRIVEFNALTRLSRHVVEF